MSFLNPGPADHAAERYRLSRKLERRWKLMMKVWMGMAGLVVGTAGVSAALNMPIGFAVMDVLLLAVCGFALVYTADRLDRARLNIRSASAELRGYGLNPEDYHD